MFLSAQQEKLVMLDSKSEFEWAHVVRPVGKNDLVPVWCKGAHINWMDGFSNDPCVKLRVTGNVRNWCNQRYRREGDHFRAYHDDGRMEQFSQSGRLAIASVRRWKGQDGSLHQHPPHKELGTWNSETMAFENPKGSWVEVNRLCTRQESGFGGDHYDLIMEDGSEVTLRGPWHTAPASGFTEVSYVDVSDRRANDKRPWVKMGGIGGLNIRNDVFIAIMSQFAAHIELAEVTEFGRKTIQPIRPDWDAPKQIILGRKRSAKAGGDE